MVISKDDCSEKLTQVRLDWLDYSRFVAAFVVMIFHYCANGIRSGKISSIGGFGYLGHVAEYGYMGVDFFFIISGFVILYSAANRPPDQFAVARMVRLYPAYLSCMTATAVVVTLWGDPATLLQYIVNLTMIAAYVGFKNIDGVYWTLGLELMFYVAVFLVILLKQIGNIKNIIYVWILLMIVLKVMSIRIPFFSGYFSLFAGGCILAFIYREGFDRINGVFLSSTIVLSVLNALERAEMLDASRAVTTSRYVVAFLTVLFFSVFVVFRKYSFKLPYSSGIGALTYPLYLLHAYIGYTILSIFANESNKWVVLVSLSIFMIFVSWLVSRYVEKAPRRIWNLIADRTLGNVVRLFQPVAMVDAVKK